MQIILIFFKIEYNKCFIESALNEWKVLRFVFLLIHFILYKDNNYIASRCHRIALPEFVNGHWS